MTIPTENSHSQNHATNKLLDGPQDPRFVQTVRGVLNPLYDLDSNYQRYGDIYIAQSSIFPPQVIISNPQAIFALRILAVWGRKPPLYWHGICHV